MARDPHPAVQVHLAWLRAAANDVAIVTRELAAIRRSEWPAHLGTRTELWTQAAFEYVLDEANRALDDDPMEGLALTKFVFLRVRRIASAPNDGTARAFRGRVYKDLGNALFTVGKLGHARAAVKRAYKILINDPACVLPRAAVQILDAYLHQLAGDGSEALRLISAACETYRRHGDERGVAYAKLGEAWMRFTRDEIGRAEELYREALHIAEEIEDARTHARALANIGQCRAHCGDDDEAVAYFAQATSLYGQLHMNAERQRIVWGIVKIVSKHGQFQLAVDALQQVRAEFLRRGQVVAAALAGLDVLELLVMLDRQDLARNECAALVATFTQVGMVNQARRAFATLHRSSKAGPIHLEMIAKARAPLEKVAA